MKTISAAESGAGLDLNFCTENGQWCVWLDPEEGVGLGCCIGVGDTGSTALTNARVELMTQLQNIEKIVNESNHPS